MKKKDVIHYYDHCETDYRLLWDLDHSHAMHAGFWDETTKTLRDALRRENEVLAEIAKIKSGDRVLDAGCGVGGSSIFLSKKYRCDVVGITLSEKQALTARSNAQKAGVASSVSFHTMDYTQTSFEDQSFDVIWGIESICHAPNKEDFIKEASRLLKKGGRIVIADGFSAQDTYTARDHHLMDRWLKGWGVSSLETINAFERHLHNHKFQNINFSNVTNYVWPSAKKLYLYSWPGIVLSKMGEWFGLRNRAQTENLHGARCHYKALKKGLWQYGIFYAEK